MNNTFLLSVCMVVSAQLQGMERKEREVKTIADMSWYCAQLAKKVSEQPLFDGEKILNESFKVLPLKTLDAKICDILSNNAEQIVGKTSAWNIHEFGSGADQLMTADGEWIESGILLDVCEQLKPCSLETLEKTYKNVITLLQIDWKQADAKDYPTIMYKEDPELWNLFIKKANLIKEADLIAFLSNKYNVIDNVTCSRYWLKHQARGCELRDEIYLWIKKDAQEKIDEIFGFKYQ